jgi:L-amino acid N-acyltransferase YncA
VKEDATMIRSVLDTDLDRVAEIYNHYILHTTVTFEEEPVTAREMASRAQDVQASSLPWLVAEEDDAVLGFAYATKWKVRAAYRHSVEITIYLDPKVKRRGIGSQLYTALFSNLKQQSKHAVIGGIALPNDESIALHEKFGMKKVAHFEQVGFKFNRWIDVAYWELVLDA